KGEHDERLDAREDGGHVPRLRGRTGIAGVTITSPAAQTSAQIPTAVIEPTCCPWPSTGAWARTSRTCALTPSRRNAAAMTTGLARWPPSAILTATPRPSGSPTA